MKTENGIALLLIVAAVFLLISHLSTNNLEFSRYNAGWNGTSDFFDLQNRHTTEDITNTSSLSGKQNSTLLIIAPKKPYSAYELSDYRSYIQRGNIIILADDFGTGNDFLRGIGSSIRILPGIVASVDRAYNDSYAIVSYPVFNHSLTRNVSSIVLDKGAALEGGEPLIKTTLMSWIDADNNARITKKEMLGKYTVLTREHIGKGEIIVLSDPSIFINAMNSLDDKWDNKIFIKNILALSNHLVIDQANSRTSDTDGYSTIMQDLKSSSLSMLAFIGLLLFILIILFIKKRYI